MLTPVASLSWFIELLLEAACCRLAFRRRMTPFWIYCGFKAIADFFCLCIYQFGSQKQYAWADLSQRTGQYLLFWALAIFISCKLFGEDRYCTRTYLGMFSVLGITAIVYYHAAPLTMDRLHTFELCAQSAAAAFVAVAFFGVYAEKHLRPKRIWEWMGYALLVKAGWDIVITGLISHGSHLESWYPVGALAALGMWAWALDGHSLMPNAGLKRQRKKRTYYSVPIAGGR